MSSEDKAIASRLLEQVWIHRNLDVLDELIAANAVIHDPTVPGLIRGPEGARRYAEIFFAAFPDTTATADDVISKGDKVAVRWSMRGTHKGHLMGIAPTGKEVTITGQAAWNRGRRHTNLGCLPPATQIREEEHLRHPEYTVLKTLSHPRRREWHGERARCDNSFRQSL